MFLDILISLLSIFLSYFQVSYLGKSLSLPKFNLFDLAEKKNLISFHTFFVSIFQNYVIIITYFKYG